MGVHADWIAFLEGNATIAAAVPGGVFHEFYPQRQAVFPVLVVQLVSNAEIDPDMDYPTGAKINQRRYQLDVWGETSKQVIDAADVIDAVLIAFSGAAGSVTIQRVERDNQADLGELNGDKSRRRVSTDYSIWY